MPRLKNRQMQIPNGLRFVIPHIKFNARPNQSFDGIVQEALRALKANPAAAAKSGIVPTYEGVCNAVDDYNARICEAMGWQDYITGGANVQPPFPHPQQPIPRPSLNQRAQSVVAGSSALVEFVANAQEAVSPELATQRAAVCADCPINGKGSLLRWFSVPASEAIRKMVEFKRSIKLSTVHDDKLGVCLACECPMKLKVWFPLERVIKNLPADQKVALHEKCWILSESAQ